MRRIALLSMLVLAAQLVVAQRVPAWMNELPTPGNSTIIYVRESGEGQSPTEATQQALARVMMSTAQRMGMPFDVQQVNQALGQGSSVEVLSAQYNLPIHKVDDYAERMHDGHYRVWVLCQVAVAGNVQPHWEELKREGESAGGMALLKSAFVPGLGQMGKGYTVEGMLTLVGEVALVGTAVGCYFMAQDDLATMRSASSTYTDFDRSHRRYEALRTTSYVAWGTAGALYVFNLARAAFVQPRHDRSLALEPMLLPASDGMAVGFMLTLNM